MTTKKTREFWSRYREDASKAGALGEGRYGTVCRAVDLYTGDTVAIKRIQMDDLERGLPSTTMREVSILRLLQGHPNIVNLRDVFYEYDQLTERRELNLVFDCMSCDLRKYIQNQKPRIDSRIVKSLMHQMCTGLYTMHTKGMFHRDLKPHNVLVDTTVPDDPVLKIADLGLGRTHSLPIPCLTHEIGSLYYRAPEVLLGTKTYGHSVDMWSVGCIFAELITNKTIFRGDNEYNQLLQIFQRIGTPNERTWPGCSMLSDWHAFPDWKENHMREYFEDGIGDAAFDLVKRLLTINPEQRITIMETLEHPYFSEDPDSDRSTPNIVDRITVATDKTSE